ncbi:outer membrane beta-barrel protein, partial [Bacteroidota bacterium]
MKKIFFTIVLAFIAINFSNAQVSYGIKGGMNIDMNSEASKYITMPAGFTLSTENSNGFHAGIWLRAKIPVVGLYVRPEINYTQIKNEYLIAGTNNGTTVSETIGNKLNKIDVPVLIGLKILKFGNIFIGPNFQYLLKSENDVPSVEDFKSEFTIGAVAGVGLEVWKLGLDIRVESGFNFPK